jgi:hypothetical protein
MEYKYSHQEDLLIGTRRFQMVIGLKRKKFQVFESPNATILVTPDLLADSSANSARQLLAL